MPSAQTDSIDTNSTTSTPVMFSTTAALAQLKQTNNIIEGNQTNEDIKDQAVPGKPGEKLQNRSRNSQISKTEGVNTSNIPNKSGGFNSTHMNSTDTALNFSGTVR